MDRLLEKEFEKLKSDLGNEIKNIDPALSYSLVGTPLIKRPFLIVGNNWGGDIHTESQTKMPLVNDILVEPDNPTYRGYISFFVSIFEENKSEAIDFLNSSVYTNGNLIRTPNENKEYRKILNSGYEISSSYLFRIIELVDPKLIVCFGNREKSATSSIFQSLNIKEPFWMKKSKVLCNTSNDWSTYKFNITANNKNFKIFSFPHSSKYNYWKKDIELNRNFIDLRIEIKKLL